MGELSLTPSDRAVYIIGELALTLALGCSSMGVMVKLSLHEKLSMRASDVLRDEKVSSVSQRHRDNFLST